MSQDQDVTPLQVEDTVSWVTTKGYRTGGQIVAFLDAETARVRTVANARHSQFGLTTVPISKLQRVTR